MKKLEEYVRSIPDFPEPGIISGTLPRSCRIPTDFIWLWTAF
ncbi:hypothetical protein CL3_04620 [butyrate-producing bacterium SM4/1]|nr:hypothetical protein CL3_04620 [butyrate-producing bacterium SM4/1]